MAKSAAKTAERPLVNLNLRAFAKPGLVLLLFFPPLFRGLFFPQEFYPAAMFATLVFVLVVCDRWLNRQYHNFDRASDLAVAAFVIAYLLSLLTAVSFYDALQTALKVATYALIFWSASRSVYSLADWRRLLAAVFVSGAAVAVVGLAASMNLLPYPGAFNGKFILSTFQYPNTLGAFLTLTIVLGLVLLVQASGAAKYFYTAGVVLQGIVLVASYSKGAMLLFPLAMVLLLLGIPREYFWTMLVNIFFSSLLILAASRFYFPAMLAGQNRQEFKIILLAVILSVLFVFAAEIIKRIVRRLELRQRTQDMIAVGIVIYLVIVVTVYLVYAAQVLPNVYAQFLPPSVVKELQSVQKNDPSIISRLVMDKDALQIVGDYPLLGAGGGGWNALYHRYQQNLYWSSEVHNHFLQTWVESGTLGFLLYLLIWALAVFTVIKIFKGNREPEFRLLTWGSAVVLLVLGIHSFMDFDLSLPAVSFILWAFLGMLQGGAALVGAAPASPLKLKLNYRWLSPLVLLLAGILVFLPANFFYRAGLVGAEGARSMAAQDLYPAMRSYQKAGQLNPWNPTYPADLSQVYAAMGLKYKDAEKRVQARLAAEEAGSRGEYNLRVQQALINTYLLLGDLKGAAAHTRQLAAANPLDINTMEILSSMYLSSGIRSLKEGDQELAGSTFKELLSQIEGLEERIKDLRPDPRVHWQGPKLELTPKIRLTRAQALLLTGETKKSLAAFQELDQDAALGAPAKIWAEAAQEILGGSPAEKIISKLTGNSMAAEPQY